ncbi:fungal protein [Schizosaccharomyces japonicus yFS275]|uniref:Fungal protein n=1 Tax=Schizosaccharomyces japonicus (strain yFS275 / FY16936) TaxID=402676 RepID=B6K7K8_SCHJY|nr:fungal protein [Schizosaccharomyces japonicus yFS275]EEB09512.1 fungal protein [Schizosaccharomyces japonicus yFS275]
MSFSRLLTTKFGAVSRATRPASAARMLRVSSFAAPAAVALPFTQRRFASMESDNGLFTAPNDKLTQMTQKLQKAIERDSEMQQTLYDMTAFFQKKGIEPGTMPSKSKLLRLVLDPEFRKYAQALKAFLEKAGIQTDPEVLSEMMKQLK